MALTSGIFPSYTAFVAFNCSLLMISFRELHFLNLSENAAVPVVVYSPTALFWDNFSEFDEQSP